MHARLRLFVALYPPPEVAQVYLTHAESLKARLHVPNHVRTCKVVPESQVHLTMQFIGDTDHRQLDETIESVARAAAGCTPLVCRPRSLVLHPSQGPARLIALELSCMPAMRELHERLARRLARRPPTKKPTKEPVKKPQNKPATASKREPSDAVKSIETGHSQDTNKEVNAADAALQVTQNTFWPHMTLLRFSPALSHRDHAIDVIRHMSMQESQWPGFTATGLSLMQSVISDSGAFHRELARIPFI